MSETKSCRYCRQYHGGCPGNYAGGECPWDSESWLTRNGDWLGPTLIVIGFAIMAVSMLIGVAMVKP